MTDLIGKLKEMDGSSRIESPTPWEVDADEGFIVDSGTSPVCGYEVAEDAELICLMRNNLPQIIEALERVEELEEALQKVEDWSNAYPVEAFTEPDWEEAKRLLGPEFLTRISAANMRYVVKGVGEIARAALTKEREGEEE